MIEKIYIPTFRRVDNQTALSKIPSVHKDKVILVIQEQEKHLYKYDVEYLIVDNNIGLTKTKEIIYRHAGKKRYGMIDDDIIWYRRNSKYYGKDSNMDKSKRECNDKDFDDMLDKINNLMNEDNVISVGHRESGFPPSNITKNSFITGAFWIDGEKLSNIIDKVDWNEFYIMQDIAFNFEVLLHGYATRKIGEFCMAHAYNSNASGGCSTYRTEEMRKDVVQRLLDKWNHLDIVKKMEDVKKPSASYWKWAEREEKRTNKKVVGLHFNFQKAYKIGQMKKQSNLEKFMT